MPRVFKEWSCDTSGTTDGLTEAEVLALAVKPDYEAAEGDAAGILNKPDLSQSETYNVAKAAATGYVKGVSRVLWNGYQYILNTDAVLQAARGNTDTVDQTVLPSAGDGGQADHWVRDLAERIPQLNTWQNLLDTNFTGYDVVESIWHADLASGDGTRYYRNGLTGTASTGDPLDFFDASGSGFSATQEEKTIALKSSYKSDTDSVANTALVNKAVDRLNAADGGTVVLSGMWLVDSVQLKAHVLIASPNNEGWLQHYGSPKHGFIASSNAVSATVETPTGEDHEGCGVSGLFFSGWLAPATVKGMVSRGFLITNTRCIFRGYQSTSVEHVSGAVFKLEHVFILNSSDRAMSRNGVQPVVHIGEGANDTLIVGGEFGGSLKTSLTPTSFDSRMSVQGWQATSISSISSTTITLANTPLEDPTGWMVAIGPEASASWRRVTASSGDTITVDTSAYPTANVGDQVILYPMLVVGLLDEGSNTALVSRPLIEFCDINVLVTGSSSRYDTFRSDFPVAAHLVIGSEGPHDISIDAFQGSHCQTNTFDQVIVTTPFSGEVKIRSMNATVYVERPRYCFNYWLAGSATNNPKVVITQAKGLGTGVVTSNAFIPPVFDSSVVSTGYASLSIVANELDVRDVSRIRLVGTTTTQAINNFANSYTGQEIEILVTGTTDAITLNQSGTIKIAGSETSLVLEAERIYKFRNVFGAFYLVS